MILSWRQCLKDEDDHVNFDDELRTIIIIMLMT